MPDNLATALNRTTSRRKPQAALKRKPLVARKCIVLGLVVPTVETVEDNIEVNESSDAKPLPPKYRSGESKNLQVGVRESSTRDIVLSENPRKFFHDNALTKTISNNQQEDRVIVDLTFSNNDGCDKNPCSVKLLHGEGTKCCTNEQKYNHSENFNSNHLVFSQAATPSTGDSLEKELGLVQPKFESPSASVDENFALRSKVGTTANDDDVRLSKRKRAPPGRFKSEEHGDNISRMNVVDKYGVRASQQSQKRMKREPKEKSRKRGSKPASQKSGNQNAFLNAPMMRDLTEPMVGMRVYARWPPNNLWYWGTVLEINKGGKSLSRKSRKVSKESFYRIQFDDGDERFLVPREDFVTEQAFAKSVGTERAVMSNGSVGRKRTLKLKLNSSGGNKAAVDVGVRCYAKFTDGGWHWGTITQMNGKGLGMTCSVLFDDGDVRDSIPVFDEIMTEANYRPEYGASNHSEIETRCRQCALCTKPDCGRCCACRGNKFSTSTFKEWCLFRSCVKLDISLIGKRVPHFPLGWRFYFKDGRSPEAPPPLHPALVGFSVVDLKSNKESPARTFSCLESAGAAAELPPDKIRKAEKQIYEDYLGLKIRKPEEHFLTGKGYCRQWLQSPGRHALLFGKIEACERNRFDDHLVFRVRYTEDSLSMIIKATSCSCISSVCEVGERVAWAGCILFEEKKCGSREILTALAETTCVPLKWMVPDVVMHDSLPPDRFSNGNWRPKQTIIYKGTKLELETRKSSIPNAGFGVFVCCSSVDSIPRDNFELENGEMLDIGTYAPLSTSDFKDGSLFLFKNFIFDGACESWSFDYAGCEFEPGQKLFDITDDATGELHAAAMMNTLSYVNETNGTEKASVRADHDPEGSVHYLLGHFLPHQGPLVFPMGKWVEIKIDYGAMYEVVRVRKGYSRLPPNERAKLEQSIQHEDKESLEDIRSWSVKDIELCIVFLETRMDDYSLKVDVRRKTLLISLRLYMRLQEVRNEFEVLWLSRGAAHPMSSSLQPSSSSSGTALAKAAAAADCCDNGYSSMEEKDLIPRLRECLRKLLQFWKSDVELRSMLIREQYSAAYLAKLLGCEASVLRRMSAVLFRAEMNKALGITTTSPNSGGGDDNNGNGGDDKNSNGGDDKNSNGGDDKNSSGCDDKNSSGGDDKNGNGGDDKNGNGGDDKNSSGGDGKSSTGGDDKKSSGGDGKSSTGGDNKNSSGGDGKNSSGGDGKNRSGGDDKNRSGGDDKNSNGGDDKISSGGDDQITSGGDDQITSGGDDKNSSGGDDKSICACVDKKNDKKNDVDEKFMLL